MIHHVTSFSVIRKMKIFLGGYKHSVVKNKRKRVSVTCSLRANIMSQSGIYSTDKSALSSGDLKSVNATDQIQSNNVLR